LRSQHHREKELPRDTRSFLPPLFSPYQLEIETKNHHLKLLKSKTKRERKGKRSIGQLPVWGGRREENIKC
jgi:hypothetical protein